MRNIVGFVTLPLMFPATIGISDIYYSLLSIRNNLLRLHRFEIVEGEAIRSKNCGFASKLHCCALRSNKDLAKERKSLAS